MGARLRLKASKDISGFTPDVQRIFRAMKRYGLIVADNGSDMYISGTMDARWDNGVLNPAFASLKASGSELPETLCGGRLAVDPIQRLIRIDGHPIGITEMEYRVLELLAFARNNVVTRQMLLKHLYRRSDDQPQPKIIDVFISKLRKKLRSASGGAEFIETIPQRGWILRDMETASAA